MSLQDIEYIRAFTAIKLFRYRDVDKAALIKRCQRREELEKVRFRSPSMRRFNVHENPSTQVREVRKLKDRKSQASIS